MNSPLPPVCSTQQEVAQWDYYSNVNRPTLIGNRLLFDTHQSWPMSNCSRELFFCICGKCFLQFAEFSEAMYLKMLRNCWIESEWLESTALCCWYFSFFVVSNGQWCYYNFAHWSKFFKHWNFSGFYWTECQSWTNRCVCQIFFA